MRSGYRWAGVRIKAHRLIQSATFQASFTNCAKAVAMATASALTSALLFCIISVCVAIQHMQDLQAKLAMAEFLAVSCRRVQRKICFSRCKFRWETFVANYDVCCVLPH